MPTNPTKLAPTTAEERAGWKELCEKATPGPFSHQPNEVAAVRFGVSWAEEIGNDSIQTGVAVCPGSRAAAIANADFFSESRTALPRLLADVDRLEAEAADDARATEQVNEMIARMQEHEARMEAVAEAARRLMEKLPQALAEADKFIVLTAARSSKNDIYKGPNVGEDVAALRQALKDVGRG